jgi:hypothetical protein
MDANPNDYTYEFDSLRQYSTVHAPRSAHCQGAAGHSTELGITLPGRL